MDNAKKSEKTDVPKKGIDYRRTEGFESRYANNAHIEMSTWDLKVNFGELDQSFGPNTVVQHTAIVLPWPYAKILAYLLQLNVMGYESANGRIIVPKGLIAPIPEEKPKDAQVSDEDYAAARAFYEEFISQNPEASPNYYPESKKKNS